MTKFKKAVILSFIITVTMTFAMPTADVKNMIFSSFSLGWSSEIEEENDDDRVEIFDDDTEIEFSFKILDLFAGLFE